MGIILNRRRVCGCSKNLPYDYEVEYLESSGTQYVDTGIGGVNDYEVSAKIVQHQSNRHGIFGRDNWLYSLVTYNGNNNIRWCNPANMYNATATYGNWHLFQIINDKLYVDGTIGIASWDTNSSNGYTRLFCGAFYNVSKVAIKYFKISRNNEILLDLIPVVKNNIGYMYDKVGGQLFGNAGTGSFIVGPRV